MALVSEALARRFLTGEPVGQRLLIDDNSTGPRPVQIVGVVENVTQTTMDGPPSLDVYIALPQIHPDGVAILRSNQFWVVRTSTEPGAFRVPFLTELRAVDPDAAVSTTGTMRQYVDAWLASRRFSLGLFVSFSMTVVLLALSGLYGLISYTVSQRRREIAVRMAVGATPGDVQRLILRQAARLTDRRRRARPRDRRRRPSPVSRGRGRGVGRILDVDRDDRGPRGGRDPRRLDARAPRGAGRAHGGAAGRVTESPGQFGDGSTRCGGGRCSQIASHPIRCAVSRFTVPSSR